MKAVVKKWGNSAAVRIPSAIMEAAHLVLDQELDVREENGVVVLEPVSTIEVSLADLVAGITAENTHGEVEFGIAVGKETDL
ncbi:MAG: AbrB/MazE/SpoVT family DNA-binding domain-containing protein [Kordiimonadaceae bacterium]|nr:AbrB/MazE/SpoVT family DNA-binding domain-containing protein [Kordiimonadaceae bacterium]